MKDKIESFDEIKRLKNMVNQLEKKNNQIMKKLDQQNSPENQKLFSASSP